jgi:hypothetical protein
LRTADAKSSGHGSLHFFGLSAWAFLHQLVVWGNPAGSSRSGALADHDDRSSATRVLESLFRIVTASDLVFGIPLAKTWSPRWPRPEAQGDTITLTVDKDGRFAEGCFEQFLANKVGKAWCSVIMHLLPSPRLIDVFKISALDSSMQAFHAALLWSCGMRLQQCILHTLDGSPQHVDLSAKVVSLNDVFDDDHLLQRSLVRYVMSGVEATEGYLHLGCCTDAASVNGLNLQATMWTTPANTCVVSIPGVIDR